MQCIRSTDNAVVSDSYCTTTKPSTSQSCSGTKPATQTQNCNTQACSAIHKSSCYGTYLSRCVSTDSGGNYHDCTSSAKACPQSCMDAGYAYYNTYTDWHACGCIEWLVCSCCN
ncbi:MAG: hypothetical protein LBD88_05280 [Candidatus Peribacteria bacterium]|nr:hypothetical protein [Candidatus Peribacteria bacterium]